MLGPRIGILMPKQKRRAPIPDRLRSVFRKPHYLLFHVTSLCNARCDFCYNQAVREPVRGPDLSVEEAGKIAAGLGNLYHLSVGGGEPFLRDDLREWITSFCARAEVRSVTVATNGSRPERVAEVLNGVVPSFPHTHWTFVLSVDAYGERHDAIRHIPGLYERTLRTYRTVLPIRRASGKNLRCVLSSVLCRANQESFLSDLERLRKDFPEMDGYEVNLVRPRSQMPGREDVEPKVFAEVSRWVTRHRSSGSGYHNLHQALFERTNRLTLAAASGKRVRLPCHAGSGFTTVDARGRVLLCEERPEEVLGDLREWGWDLRALLRDPAVASRVARCTEGCFCRSDCVIRYNLTRAPREYPGLAAALLSIPFRSVRRQT